MSRWAGWGAGPAGAGAARPSRLFLLAALCGMAVLSVISFWDRRWPLGVLAALAALYFALRLFGGLGGRKDP